MRMAQIPEGYNYLVALSRYSIWWVFTHSQVCSIYSPLPDRLLLAIVEPLFSGHYAMGPIINLAREEARL